MDKKKKNTGKQTLLNYEYFYYNSSKVLYPHCLRLSAPHQLSVHVCVRISVCVNTLIQFVAVNV